MAWTVPDAQHLLADGNSVLTIKPSVWLKCLRVNAILAARFFDPVNPKLIFRMWSFDWQT
jgi:hypothetical protein